MIRRNAVPEFFWSTDGATCENRETQKKTTDRNTWIHVRTFEARRNPRRNATTSVQTQFLHCSVTVSSTTGLRISNGIIVSKRSRPLMYNIKNQRLPSWQ